MGDELMCDHLREFFQGARCEDNRRSTPRSAAWKRAPAEKHGKHGEPTGEEERIILIGVRGPRCVFTLLPRADHLGVFQLVDHHRMITQDRADSLEHRLRPSSAIMGAS